MKSPRFSLGQLLCVVLFFPLAIGVAAASSFGAFTADDLLGGAVASILGNVMQGGLRIHFVSRSVTDFIGISLALAVIVASLTSSRLAPLRLLSSLVIFALPVFVGIQEFLLSRDDRTGSLFQHLQAFLYYRWDAILVTIGAMGVLWCVRSFIARRRPGTLSFQDWRSTASIGAKALTGLLLMATVTIAAVGFLWLRDLSLMGC